MKDKQIILKESVEWDKNFWLEKLKSGCISGSESNIVEKDSYASFEIETKKGKKLRFDTNYYFLGNHDENGVAQTHGKWRCNTSKSNNNVKKPRRLVDTDVNTVDY
jgi:hypothetical protein